MCLETSSYLGILDVCPTNKKSRIGTLKAESKWKVNDTFLAILKKEIRRRSCI